MLEGWISILLDSPPERHGQSPPSECEMDGWNGKTLFYVIQSDSDESSGMDNRRSYGYSEVGSVILVDSSSVGMTIEWKE